MLQKRDKRKGADAVIESGRKRRQNFRIDFIEESLMVIV